jgi:hypothetical protein
MSQQITTAFVQQYTTNVQLLLQQRGSRLRSTVMEGAHVGEQAVAVDQIGKVTATRRTTRYPDLTPQDTPADRRWVFPADYDWNDLIDNADKLRMLTDPQSSYVQNGVNAMGRAMDDEIIAAFFGTSKTGKAGSTSTTFPSGNQIAVNFGAAGNTGLTVAKLREAKRLLLAAEVDVENDPLYVPVTSKQHDNLLGEAQVISLDYNDRPTLVNGRITQFMGFTFVHSERLQLDGSSYRRVPAYSKTGMHLGVWNDIRTDVSQRKDKAGLPWQVYVYGTFGATRLEEAKIIEIKCSEA